jgi:hypothetical protein
MPIDISQIKKKLVPTPDGQDELRLRTGVVDAINANGTVDIVLSGVTMTNVPVLATGYTLTVDRAVQVATYRGSMLVLGHVTASEGDTVQPRFVGSLAVTGVVSGNVTTFTPTGAIVNIGGMWVSGTNITIPSGGGGEYRAGISLRLSSQNPAIGFRQARVNVNGSEHMQWNASANGVNGTNTTVMGQEPLILDDGDTVSFGVFHNATVNLDVIGNSRCWLERVGNES